MGVFIDLTDQKFNRLLVLRQHHKARPGMIFWECRCDCGTTCVVAGMHLRSGNTTSCGCRRLETMIELPASTTTHGLAKSRIYGVFHAMHARCSDPKHKDFHLYGGRGIKVCKRWWKPGGFVAFVKDMGLPPDGATLDRKNTNGNYTPRNCRWATHSQQARNRRNSRLITWRGLTLPLADWADMAGLTYMRLYNRIKRLPLDEAMRIVPSGTTENV